MAKERASDLEQLTEHLEAGRLVPTLAESYPLDQAKTAMQLLEAGKVPGKVVIIPGQPTPGDTSARNDGSNVST
jgi:NADPH:quinone reductase-like Zn-dependent oxidoreductase